MAFVSKWHALWIGIAASLILATSFAAWRRHSAPMEAVQVASTDANRAYVRPNLVAAAQGSIYVHVAGQVAKPGLYRLPAGSRVMDAVSNAGGALPDADLNALNLATALADGQKLTVPSLGEGAPPPPQNYLSDPPNQQADAVLVRPDPPSPTTRHSPAPQVEDSTAFSMADVPVPPPGRTNVTKLRQPGEGVVNINNADEAEMQRLPGVGPATAAKIIAYRDSHGGFKSADELMEVKGIGPAKLRKMQPFVVLH